MVKQMAPKRDKPANKRLVKLRGDMLQPEFGKKYFYVSPRTYQRYESTEDAELPGPVLLLIEFYETHGLKLKRK